uniref:Ig-like domain-containing protein n=1 Tax=Chelydra serpentina TaxID=8475 RepID=A0A8C3XSH1_CHESE
QTSRVWVHVPRVSLSLSLAGCWAVTGPGAVSGPPGGSVAVRCRYREGSERYQKFWCRAGSRRRCSNGHIVQTDGSEAEVTRGRVSIRDNHPQRVFTVTVGNLTPADAGTYRCGVGRWRWRWAHDLSYPVELTVSPGKSRRAPWQCRGSVPSPIPTARTPQATKQPDSPPPTKAESMPLLLSHVALVTSPNALARSISRRRKNSDIFGDNVPQKNTCCFYQQESGGPVRLD